ncbi:MAG: Ig-like domain-containing protein, partial [Paramuribaculum sp.]|nr:Ig-like domain-containing protein [Paramuribaculum sp.]
VNPVLASTITLNVEDMTLTVGQSDQLTAVVYPHDTTNPTVTWSSDNPDVATVDESGIVTAVAPGRAIITASCDGVSALCTVMVIERPLTPQKLLRKGNGTSCTFIVMMSLSDNELAQQGYSFVYGYTDASGKDNVIAHTHLRYCNTTSSVYNDPKNDFWVFAVWTDSAGNTVCSQRRHLSGSVDDNFDYTNLIRDSRSIDGTNSANWIIPTANGVQITVESSTASILSVYTITGQKVLEQHFNAGEFMSEQITAEQLVPNTYIVNIVSGDETASKKISIK